MLSPKQDFSAVEFDPDLIRRFDHHGPRYTSYPTADRFADHFEQSLVQNAIEDRRQRFGTMPWSIYLHVPFCRNVCFYCACNKIGTKDSAVGDVYLDYVARELALYRPLMGKSRRVSQMHWGGGSPTFLNAEQLRRLWRILAEHVDFVPDGEFGIEIDPRTLNPEQLPLLREIGFNRVSLGVQDFNLEVQQAVNRVQPAEMTLNLIAAAKAEGMKSVNIDLIYGLPKQSLGGFGKTLDEVVQALPDRIAVYSYAHLPQRFKPQRRIVESDLPNAETKLKLLQMTVHRLTQAGYVYIGMDHFARPEDELAVAFRQGRLHRNFQGYSTHSECDMLALGVSSISRIGPLYSQNYRDLHTYYHALDQGQLPVFRGFRLTADDLLRRAVIQSLMCQFYVDFETFENAFLIDFKQYFAHELSKMEEFILLDMIDMDDTSISVNARGRLLVRSIAMVFDKYLRMPTRGQFSRLI